MGPGDITPKFWKKRYRQINDYERYLDGEWYSHY